jgi:hypothetical protein
MSHQPKQIVLLGRGGGGLVMMVKLGKMKTHFSKYACKVTLLKGW